MHRSTMNPALCAALFVPCLLLSACGQEAVTEMLRPPVNPETEFVPPHAPIRKGYARNATNGRLELVHYAEVGGLAVVEGDMIIGTVEEMEARRRDVEKRGGLEAGGVQAQGVVRVDPYGGVRWRDAPGPNVIAVVPYTIDPNVPSRLSVNMAIQQWEFLTNNRVDFVERTESNQALYPDFVTFWPAESGCAAATGRRGGQQFVYLSKNCSPGIIMHEIGHVLGLFHEHTRADRDSFVTILWENIISGKEGDFQQNGARGNDVLAYDYDSIMHYAANAHSKNGLPTIQTIGAHEIGQSNAPSRGDVNAIKRIYSIDDSEVFVWQTFLDVLERAPRTGIGSGFNFYFQYLADCNGDSACLAARRVAVAREVLESPENREQDPELKNTDPSGYNAAFVNQCYKSFLRRAPDAAGYAMWLNVLNSGGDYNAVVSGFINSTEYRARFSVE